MIHAVKSVLRKVGVASLLLLAPVLCGPGWGGALLEGDPGREGVPGKQVRGGARENRKGMEGWKSTTSSREYPHSPGYAGSDYVLYTFDNAAAFPAGRGSAEVVVRRDAGEGPLEYGALIDFIRRDNSSALTAYVVWDTPGLDMAGGDSYLDIWGPGYRGDLWGAHVSLGRHVRPGETVTLTFTWGEGRNAVYVDGKESPAYFSREWTPASRDANPATYFSAVDRVRLGLASERGRYYPGGFNPLNSATVFRLKISDAPFAPAPAAALIREISDDTFKVRGISGKLVAGDKVAVELMASPGGKASFDMGKVTAVPMEEVPPREAGPGIPAVAGGTYRGVYTIRPGDDHENGQIAGRFVSADNVTAEPVLSASKWTIDTKPRVAFSIDRRDLPADSSTKARIKVVAKDANGNPVKGRRLKLTLATTDQYTGTVGAGDFGKQVGGAVETRWRGETDSWGEVEFDYTAGFAAKTVILTAKDLDSGGTAVDYVTAYKDAAIDIALTKVVSRAAVRRSVQYLLKVEASRTEITADGRSRSVIRATLLDPNGTSVAGDPVAFTLSSPNGSLRTIQGTTDSGGVATAEYTAGNRIGIVVVTATATLRNAQGQVSIILLADAPAKIYLKARPDTLPADGVSRADIQVKVTDVNDNPNRDTKVDFRVTRGAGKLAFADRVTDRYGDASNVYTSGTEAGVATVLATVRSRVPTEAELATARNVLFVPYTPEGDEIRVEKWLKKKGDTVRQGEPLMEYTVGRSRQAMTLVAPYDLTLGDILVEYWNPAEVGQTLATVVPAARP